MYGLQLRVTTHLTSLMSVCPATTLVFVMFLGTIVGAAATAAGGAGVAAE